MATASVETAKADVRRRVWALLEREGAAPQDEIFDRIPSFYGAEEAAVRLATQDEWKDARTIKTVPDKAQFPVRVRALHEGKLVYMAVPKLAKERPFFLLDPKRIEVSPEEAASTAVANATAETVDVESMGPVDLVVCGSVAVNRRGVRIGKGAGYSDIEIAILQDAGLISSATPIITTVHSLQVMEESLPEAEHDFRVDLIITPSEIIRCDPVRRPAGIIWEELTAERIAAIPALRRRSTSSDGRSDE